jgi:hypothetical protein
MSWGYVLARRVAVVLAAVAAMVSTAKADGTPPGENGRIVFERLRFQNGPGWGELFVMSAQGSSVFKLTHPPNGTEDTNPDWSPDGARVAFTRARALGAHSVWTVNADGTDPNSLNPACPPGGGIPRCPSDDGWPVCRGCLRTMSEAPVDAHH